jgi:type IV secretory pathway TrbD component
MFSLLYWFARWATKTDPQILRLLLNSSKARTQYDPMKFASMPVRSVRDV